MNPEVHIVAGKSINEALSAFRDSVSQPGMMRCHEQWLLIKLEHLQQLLSEPITHNEPEALLDVLHQRHSMEELIEWLENRPIGWQNFLADRAALREEAKEQYAQRRERWRTERRDLHSELGIVSLYDPISDTCPDCDSSEWKPIIYGRPSEETLEDARRGEFVLGGGVFRDPQRYCTACVNYWPSKPEGGRPAGRPEWIEQRILESRSEYAKLSALADRPPSPEEPHVDRAWARIDGSVEFLISLGKNKARVTKNLAYARLGGAPVYEVPMFWAGVAERLETHNLAAVAALRFERTHEPEKHNLSNDWDKIQAHWRELKRSVDLEAFGRELVMESAGS